MWAKTIRTVALAALAAAAWGCGKMSVGTFGWPFGGNKKPTTQPTTRGAATEEKAELAEAVNLILQSQYEEAAGKLQDLITRLAASGPRSVTAEATFWLGYCREKQDRLDEAAQCYRRVVEEYKDTPAAGMAEERLKNLGGKIV